MRHMINVVMAMLLLLFCLWDPVQIQTQRRFNLYLMADTRPLRRYSLCMAISLTITKKFYGSFSSSMF